MGHGLMEKALIDWPGGLREGAAYGAENISKWTSQALEAIGLKREG